MYGSFVPPPENVGYACRGEPDGKRLTVLRGRTCGTAPCAPADSLEGEELISNYASHKKGCLLPYEARVILEG